MSKSNSQNNYKRKNSNGKANKGRNNMKGKFRDGSIDKRNDHSQNDPSWYFKYPELMNATAKLAFPNRPGMTIPDVISINTSKPYDSGISVPGVLALNFIPSIGQSKDVTDPASLTAKELYSAVRSQFSGSLNADAPDLFIQVMALDSIYSYIASLKRVYRTLTSVSPDNYMLPYGIMNALGYTDEQTKTLLENRLDFYGVINTLVRSTQKFILPAVFSVMDRHYWMNDRVFSDYPDMNSQLYVMKQEAWYKFALLETSQGEPAGGLSLVPFQPPKDGLIKYLLNYGLDMIDALAAWDECYDINGYFMKAFPNKAVFLDLLNENETLQISYDRDVLFQIENSTSLPINNGSYYYDPSNYTFECDVTQDPLTNSLISNPTVIAKNVMNWEVKFTQGGLVNTEPGVTSEQVVVEATRLKARYGATFTDGTNTTATSTARVSIIGATEIVLDYTLVTGQRNIARFSGFLWINNHESYMTGGSIYNVHQFLTLTWFRHHPALPIITVDEEGNISTRYYTELRNVAKMSLDMFDAITRVCLFSEFNSFS